MSVATVQDVAEWMGWPVDDPQLASVPRWLDATELRMKLRVPNFAARVAADADYKALVRDIECTAVERKLRNIDGFASESTDNVAVSFKADSASGNLKLTDEEWADLGVSQGVGSLRITPDPQVAVLSPLDVGWGPSWPF